MSIEYYLDQKNGQTPTACEVFKAAAKDTWARIHFSRKTPRLKIHETSITQNLVYEMILLKEQYEGLGKSFSLFESTNEKAHGDDLELTICAKEGEITYAIQSKIIYHKRTKKDGVKFDDGYYRKLRHWVGKDEEKVSQISLLLKYSLDNNFIPLYLLYNYVDKSALKGEPDSTLFGCTIVPANYLISYHSTEDHNLDNKVSFSKLHPTYAIPWHELVCESGRLKRLLDDNKIQKKDNSLEEIIRDDLLTIKSEWKAIDLVYPETIPKEKVYTIFMSDDYSKQEIIKKEEEPPVFLPKFKIIIDVSKT